MDDAKTSYLTSLILFLGLSLSLGLHALDLEYVSPEVRQELEREFKSSKLAKSDQIKNKQWTCDMYGMRTHLQVKRDVKLYHWKNADSWQNDGAQIVQEYRVENDSLIGRTDRFEDQVKVNSKGQLISQFSVTSPNRHVVAYSVCKVL